MDPEYVSDVLELARRFESYRKCHGTGDPDAPPHREDNPEVIAKMRGKKR